MQIREMQKEHLHAPFIYLRWVKLEADETNEGFLVPPDNQCEILFNLGAPFERKVIHAPDIRLIGSRECVMLGTRSRGIRLISKAPVEVLAARIAPWQIHLLLGLPMEQLRDRMLTADDYLPNLTQQLQALSSMTVKAKLESMQRILIKYFSPEQQELAQDPVLLRACTTIRRNPVGLRVGQLCDQLGVSKTTLESKFRRQVGISPKEYCRVEKLKTFLKTYESADDGSLTQTAMECGYYDQSHLIKEFQYFTGVNPRAYFAQWSARWSMAS